MKFIFFIMLTCSLFCSGCSIKFNKLVKNNLSEIAEFIVVGRNDDLKVTLMCGKRENDYKINGYSTNLISYGVISVTLFDKEENVNNVNFVLYVGTKIFDGVMEKNPFNEDWVVDIKQIVNKNDNMSIDIFINGEKQSLKLMTIDDDWGIDSSDIVLLLIKDYKEELKFFIKDNEFCGEIYIKIIDNGNVYSDEYLYYVSIVGRDGQYFNFLIQPDTSEILAINKSF